MQRNIYIFKAATVRRSDTPPPDLKIEMLESLSSNAFAPSAPQHVVDEAMLIDAQALVAALHDTLPQGTWARVVALMARQWADDQQGILSASAWYPGLSRKEE
jgi:hypothetical protein